MAYRKNPDEDPVMKRMNDGKTYCGGRLDIFINSRKTF